jgi:cytochrome P450
MALDAAEQTAYPSPELIECPYPFFDRVRASEPVRYDVESGVYQLFDHEDIMFVLRHGEIFPHTGRDTGGGISYEGVPMISATGPPEHTAMRRLAFGPFKPGRLNSYEPMIENFVTQLIDGFIDRGEIEFVSEFAIPLPALVTCRLMGFPESGPDFDFIVDRMSMKSSDKPGVSDQGLGLGEDGHRRRRRDGIHEYMHDALVERHAQPGDDILSELVQAQVARDGELNLPYLVTICTELLSGGVVTTAQMMVNALLLVLEHPEQLARVRADHSLIPWMFEETLRVESPVQSLTRVCVADCELSGVKIPAGSTVLMVFGSANRDPQRFPHPDRFDIDRPRDQLKVHFGFGYGRHFCLGAPLARREGDLAFQQLFTRMGEIRLADGKNDFKHIASTHFRALRSLHLTFEPAGSA